MLIDLVARAWRGVVLAILSVTPATADSVAEFYRGSQIQLIIGYGAGGGYDLYARLLANHMGKHIPGNPSIVPVNMPGGSSRKAANWLYNVAPRNGAVLATIGQATPFDQALGRSGGKYDAVKFGWIGNLLSTNNIVVVWHMTGVKTVEDARKVEVVMGATGASSPSVMYPLAMNRVLGTKFKIITGYRGGAGINLAMERGEVGGRGSVAWQSLKATNPQWVEQGKLNLLVQVGDKRAPDLPDVPLLAELAKNAEDRQVLELISSSTAVGRPILTTPKVPTDRLAALRRAFDATVVDSKFLAAAAQQKMELEVMGWEALERIVKGVVSTPKHIIEKTKKVIAK